MAFDHDNRDIIMETDIAAKICCRVVDIGHEVLGGQQRTAEHCGRKTLHAEFLAKPVLCLSEEIARWVGKTSPCA